MPDSAQTAAHRRFDLQRFFPLILPVLGFTVLYHQVIYNLVLDWMRDDNYSHGFLIPVISGYLIWMNRHRITAIPIRPAGIGLFLLLASLGFYLVTDIGAEQFTMRFSMLLVIMSAVIYMAGWQMGKALLFPVAYLIFMIPLPAIIWNQIAFPLKLFATKLSVGAIQILGITVFREGNIIHLTSTTLEVVDACSGLRSLTSLLALSAAFALITDHTRAKQWILFFSAVPIAIFVNIVRLTITAALASRYGEQVAQGFLHEASGIVIFFLALILLYAFHRLLGALHFSSNSKE